MRASATPGEVPAITNLKKPSPSPSVKRGKAERLLKEHGSPPGMRVTAGGRVVPSDLPPLSSVRFGSNTFRAPFLQGVDTGNAMSTQSQQDQNNTANLAQVQLIGTQAVIRVGDRMFALPTYNSAYPVPTDLPTDMEPAKSTIEPAKMPMTVGAPGVAYTLPRSSTQSPFPTPDLATIETQWNHKKDELRFVEQTEVLQADHQGPAWRSQVIAKKKSLILEIDALRKQVSAAKEAESSKGSNSSPPSIALSAPGAPVATAPPALMPQFQQPIPSAMFQNIGAPIGIPTQTTYAPMVVYQPFTGQTFPADVPTFGRENQLFVSSGSVSNGNQFTKTYTQSVNVPQSPPGSASRRSHAVPIKKPHEQVKKQVTQGSTLDPKSPTYEPVVKSNGKDGSQGEGVPPTPSPTKRSPWRVNELDSSQSKHGSRAISQKPSLSSIDTTDFFPNNTHEHSSTRIAPNKLSKQASRENEAEPTTPEKPWQFGPWNPPSGGLSNRVGLSVQQDPLRKLTSWPEAFGKQSSTSSGKENVVESRISSGMSRKTSAQRTGIDLNWPPIPSKPPSHIPSTYQEGYQAGLHHFGLPENHEVLNGFVDGLMAYLKDFTMKDTNRNAPWFLADRTDHVNASSARSSLRAHLSGATLHESAVSLSENIRSAKINAMPRKELAYSPNSDSMNKHIVYELCNEVGRESRKSPTNSQQGKTDLVELDLNGAPLGRQFSGNQLANRAYGTSVSMHRYYPSAKEYVPGAPSANLRSARPGPRNRFSGLDGAMDDLAGLLIDSHMDDKPSSEGNEAEASCFKSGKGKQKMTSSPAKSANGAANEASSPGKASESPKKSGEHSPAKAKLEHVTNKLRRPKKDDPRTMSPEEKADSRRKWRNRFQTIRKNEREDIEKYARNNSRRDAA